jgi:GH25 family lysozyme M1 (1,4-beta-N-acetylmuramidase)
MTATRTFQPLAAVQSAQGLDVSNFQGKFRWAGTPGLSFGINRVTQGLGAAGTNSPDPEAGWNHAAIRDAGLHRGAYHFLDPYLDGAAQARYMVDILGKLGLVKDDMLFCDSETTGPSPGATARCAAAFMTELRTLRPENPVGVYTYINFAKQGYCGGLGGWPLWLAYPSSTAPLPPPPWVTWQFWQWGTRNGVDADAFNGTAADLTAWIASFQPVPDVWRELVTGGTLSLEQIAGNVGMLPSSVLRHTATHYGAYDAVTSAYVDGLASGAIAPDAPVPPGARLWVRI